MQTHGVARLVLAALAVAGCRPTEETEACYPLEDTDTDPACLAADEVDPDDLQAEWWCGIDVVSVEGPGEERSAFQTGTPACCYPVLARNTEPNCAVGRPYVEEAGPALARADAVGRSRHAAAWVEAARGEHASIAAFARLTLDLLALGAPLDLVADVQRAAADEVAHVTLCGAVVAALGGTPPVLGPFPFTEPVVPRTDAAAVAEACVRDGCLGETVGAWLAERAASEAEDPEVRHILETIAADEARHAALSWRIVAWLVTAHGEEVRARVAAAFATPLEVGPADHLWGGVSRADMPALLAEAHAEVLEPAALAILALA